MDLNILNIAILQFDIKAADKKSNLNKIESLLKSQNNVDLIVLPEMFASGFEVSDLSIIEPASSSSTLQWMKEKAVQMNCAIVGSIGVSDSGENYNRLYFVFPDATYQYYNKRHLFRFSDEFISYKSGKEPVIIDYCGWKISLSVCYDLRFPVSLRNTYSNSSFNYDLLINVASWPSRRENVWKALLAARSIENLSYIVGVNRIGIDKSGTSYSGNSMICNMNGDLIFNADSKEGCFRAQLFKSALIKARADFNVGLDWDSFKLTEI